MNRKAIAGIIGAVIIVAVIVVGFGILNGNQDEKVKSMAAASQDDAQLWTCGMHPEVIVDEPGQCPKCGMDLVPVKQSGAAKAEDPPTDPSTDKDKTAAKKDRKILYWQAPMDPTEIYDHPGKSKMGMDLVPVYEDQVSGSGGTVKIDPVTVQNMGVRYTTVKKMDFNRDIRAVGLVQYNEEKLYTINSKISGWIEKLYVDYTGKMVRKGQPLLEIYSPDLVTTQEEYLLALNNQKAVSASSFGSIRDGAESLLKSTRKRLDYWDIPNSEIDRLEKTGEVRKTLQLVSPANGVVVHKNAVEGAKVNTGMDLYHIADLSTVWVEASVYDYELPWISEGQTAEMELSYLPDKRFTGKISYIYPYLDEKARTAKIRLEFKNPNLELKPGMYANVYLEGKTIPNTLVIPSEAVIRSGERNLVFIARGEGKFEPRQVQVGAEGGPNNRYFRVLSGLLDGEKVVTSAQFLLDSESRLQEAIQKMLEEKKGKSQTSKRMEMPEMEQQKKIQQNS
jgi:multidrug efflux pump subunit AcrA (membrane-fusion protein)